jgi:phosphoglycerate dehydrogenase-like enzyme
MPQGVAVRLLPENGPIPEEASDAEFLVPPYGPPNLVQAMARMPRLRVVQTTSAGVDWLDGVPPGVVVCNARGLRDRAVVEWVLAAILAMEKQLPYLWTRQAQRRREHLRLPELAGRTALVVGHGSIGQALGGTLEALGVHVLRVARTARTGVHSVHELRWLLPRADIVVLVVPLDQSTEGMFDAAAIDLMRAGALLVNAARGRIVDTDALLAALEAGRIRAALDVTAPEPLPTDHPLWSAPGLLLTPHLAGDSPAAEERVYRFVGDQLRRYVGGEPLQNVIPRHPVPREEHNGE